MEDNIRDKVLDSVRDLRKEIIGRGGDISTLAGLKDFPSAIYNIPADNAITTITQEEVSQFKKVPENSTKYAYLAEFGGMTYKCANLIPFPYPYRDREIYGVKFTVNNGIVTGNGTATQTADFVLIQNTYFSAGTYTISGCTDGSATTHRLFVWIVRADGSNAYYNNHNAPATFVVNDGDMIRFVSIRVASGATINNATVVPMINKGDTALPYEPYYEGLRNTKPTEVVSKGVNLYSGPTEFVLDGTDKNITIPIVGAEEITTFSFARDGTRVNAASLFQLVYEDGTVFGIAPGVASGVETIKYTSKSKVTAIKLVNWCKFTGRIYDIQLENGSVATGYKPFVGTISTRAIPAEIQALDGFGEGINVNYYNKVDLVNRKYKMVIETFYFDGSNDEEWQARGNLAEIYGYVAYKVGARGTYNSSIVICDKIDQANISSNNVNIGIDMIASSGYNADFVAIRPTGIAVSIKTLTDFIQWLKANPVTVKVARKVPIETDLSVYMSPLIEVEGGGTVEFVNEYGYGVPSKIVYQTKQSEVI